MPTPLELAFNNAMVEVYRRADSEAKYKATYFIKMVSEMGGLKAAKQLIDSSTPSEGYTELWRRGRLDLTMEALVVENPKWHPLFDTIEIAKAKQRLIEYRYPPLI